MDIDHDPLVRVIAGLAHPDSIPFLLERASALVDFKHLVDLALLDCLAFLNEGELPLLFAWLERHDGLPELPRVFQSIEDVLPMMRRCGENPDCYLEHALELMDPSDGEPEFFGRREEFQLRKALVMLRRFGAERHADALLPLIGTRFGRAEFLRTLERLGGDTVIALLGEQDDEELLRLHHRMALRRSILGQ